MKKTTRTQPRRRYISVLRQVIELIPPHLVSKIAREHGVDAQARTFCPFSHVVALMYAQLAHALSLNDVCDALRMMATPLLAVRGARPPSRNALSHANKTRACAMAKQLFWSVLRSLQNVHPGFGRGNHRTPAWRFKRSIQLVDATVINLVASCVHWANHNRRKAAVKCHVRLNARSLLPSFAVVGSAREHDVERLHEICDGLQPGEVAIFDRGYHLLAYFYQLTLRQVFFVTRARENVRCRVLRRRECGHDPRIIADEEVRLGGLWVKGDYPERLRRVTAIVEVDGVPREMKFLTNNFEWSASSVADLYRCRWQIEVFFKQIKQTLQLGDFLGRSANAVSWQIWTALLVYVLLRFLAWRSRWTHSFSRLFTLMRAALWLPRDLGELLRSCGTAPDPNQPSTEPRQSWFPGFIT